MAGFIRVGSGATDEDLANAKREGKLEMIDNWTTYSDLTRLSCSVSQYDNGTKRVYYPSETEYTINYSEFISYLCVVNNSTGSDRTEVTGIQGYSRYYLKSSEGTIYLLSNWGDNINLLPGTLPTSSIPSTVIHRFSRNVAAAADEWVIPPGYQIIGEVYRNNVGGDTDIRVAWGGVNVYSPQLLATVSSLADAKTLADTVNDVVGVNRGASNLNLVKFENGIAIYTTPKEPQTVIDYAATKGYTLTLNAI